jgi:hypothetical protein
MRGKEKMSELFVELRNTTVSIPVLVTYKVCISELAVISTAKSSSYLTVDG